MKPLHAILLLPLLSFAVNIEAQTLDPTFGTSGIAQTTIGAASAGFGITTQADGRILCAGGSDSSAVLVRYLANGTLDASFASGGIATLDLGGLEVFGPMVVQPDGKIIVAGRTSSSPAGDFLIARYNTDGTLDATFGTSGVVITDIGGGFDYVADMILQPDGGIVVAGASQSTGSSIVVARFLINGALDNTFNGDGIFTTTFISGNYHFVTGLALQPDGALVVGGNYVNSSATKDRYAIRLLPNGTLDNSFGTAGAVFLDVGANEDLRDVLLQNDGRILLVGHNWIGTTNWYMVITRLMPNGTLDLSYGSSGNVTSADLGGYLFTQQSCLQTDGKLVVASNYNTAGPISNPRLWRLNTDGSFDVTFGTSGYVDGLFGDNTTSRYMFSAAQQTDGKLLICGRSEEQITVARLGSGQMIGIEETASAIGGLIAYPVPVHDRLHVRSNSIGIDRIEVVDLSGRTMIARSVDHTSLTETGLDMSALPAGSYTLRAFAAGKVTNLFFIKR